MQQKYKCLVQNKEKDPVKVLTKLLLLTNSILNFLSVQHEKYVLLKTVAFYIDNYIILPFCIEI